jgi:uncharacterized membrane protein
VLLARRYWDDHPTLRHVEPWLLGGAIIGIAAAGLTGLLVRGQAETMLRGHSIWLGNLHFWLGLALALLLLGVAALRWSTLRRGRPTHGRLLTVAGVVAFAAVFVQGYAGGRMTYDQGVGVAKGGQLAQSASGAATLAVALTHGVNPVAAGRRAFSANQLGCATCHGALAQGLRGPRLAGGVDLDEFRHVHGTGLFPPRIVSDREFQAINAFLKTLGPSHERH